MDVIYDENVFGKYIDSLDGVSGLDFSNAETRKNYTDNFLPFGDVAVFDPSYTAMKGMRALVTRRIHNYFHYKRSIPDEQCSDTRRFLYVHRRS